MEGRGEEGKVSFNCHPLPSILSWTLVASKTLGKSINPLDLRVCKVGLTTPRLAGCVRTEVAVGRHSPLIWAPYQAAIPLTATISKLVTSAATAGSLAPRPRSRAGGAGRTHPRGSPSHPQAHPHPLRRRRGRAPRPGLHLGGKAPGSKDGVSPGPLPSPEPPPIRAERTSLGAAGRALPGAADEGPTRGPSGPEISSPRAPAGALQVQGTATHPPPPCRPNSSKPSTHTLSRDALESGAHSRERSHEVAAQEWHQGGLGPLGPRLTPRDDAPRPPAAGSPSLPRGREGTPARAWRGQGTHRWTQA